jgi:aminoglycoside 3-N-acetyltransferase I
MNQTKANYHIEKLDRNSVEMFRKSIELFNKVFENNPSGKTASDHHSRLLAKEHFHVFCAINNLKVIGACTVYELTRYATEGDEYFIYDLAVDEAFQRMGIGTALLDAVRKFAGDRNINSIFVLAHADDEGAVNFYEQVIGKSESVRSFDLK